MNHRILARALLAAALSPLSLAAQVTDSTRNLLGIEPTPFQLIESTGSALQMAMADSYKVAIEEGRTTFIPYAGADAPENLVWSWETVGFGRGADLESVALAGESVVDGTRHEQPLSSASGVAFVERYDVLAEGLEQSFVVPQRPDGLGDLIVQGRVDSNLVPVERSSLAVAPIRFVDEGGRDVLEYGAAFGVDSAGQTIELGTRVLIDPEIGTRIEIVVPEDFVETAAYPLTIDPLVQRTLLEINQPIAMSDVCYDEVSDDTLYVYTTYASASDRDVVARLCNGVFTNPFTVFTDPSTNDVPDVACAAAGPDQDMLIVYSESLLNRTQIRARDIQGGQFITYPASVVVADSFGQFEHYWRVDVGGTRAGGPRRWRIVTQYDFALTLDDTGSSSIVEFDVSGSITGATRTTIVSAGLDAGRPSINQAIGSSSPSSDWFVAYQSNSATLGRIGVVALDRPRSPLSWMSSSTTEHFIAPQIAGDAGRYLVAYGTLPNTIIPPDLTEPHGRAVSVQRLDASLSPIGPSRRIAPARLDRQYVVGAVGFDHETGSHWSAQVTSDRQTGGDGRALLQKVGYQGLLVESSILFSPIDPLQNAVPGGVTFVEDGELFATTWGVDPNGGFTTDTLLGDTQDYEGGGSWNAYGSNCGSQQMIWQGGTLIGSEFTQVLSESGPANQNGVILISLALADLDLAPAGFPGCRALVDLGSPNFLTSVPVVSDGSGNAVLPLPLPESLNPGTLYFQSAFLGGGPTLLAFSEGLQVSFTR